MGECRKNALQVDFDRTLRPEFHGSKAVPRGLFRAILERIRRLRLPQAVPR